jgi:hypothetical protein
MGAGLSNGATDKVLKMSSVSVSHAISRVRREMNRNPTGLIADWANKLNEEND